MDNYIICPNCGAEYLPVEIFIPNAFFGEPEYIKRDLEGKIQAVAGTHMDTSEVYKCDVCRKTFKVITHVDFTCELEEESPNASTALPYTERFRMKEF